MSSRFNTLNRYRVLWTDIERTRYLRTLAANAEERLRLLEARPGTPPEQVIAEKIAIQETRKEIRRAETRVNDL